MEGKLRTGFVKANSYAVKTRKVGYAKAENVNPKIVNAEVARLNQFIYEKLRKANIDKNAVIRVQVPYRTFPFGFDFDSTVIEVYKFNGVL